MPLISACLLLILSKLETIICYTYQTAPLFLSFSDLVTLEANSHFGDDAVRAFVVKCHEDSIEVVMKAHLFDPGLPVEPEHFRLGPAHHRCTAQVSEEGDYIIRARLNDCGGEMMFTQSALLYKNLLYSPPWSPGATLQAEGAAVPVHCEYGRRYSVSSGPVKPTWTPPISVQSTLLDLDFHLRLMTDDWSGERKSSIYFLGETVNIEASVDHHHHHPPLRLYVHSCVATLATDVNSYPRYSFIDHQGCFTDSQLHGSSSRFLPRVRDELLQIQLEPFFFYQDHRHTVYITCYLEAQPISNREPVKKACSFDSGRWRSVDGDDHVCESCSRVKSNHRRALKSKTKHRHTESPRGTSLGPMILNECQL